MSKNFQPKIPKSAEALSYDENGSPKVPDQLIIPFIIGDGTGPDIWNASLPVFNTAVEYAYQGARKIYWMEILAGEKAFKETGKWLPKETLSAIRDFHIAIKGPLTTPIAEGIRSLNVAIRQKLALYACVRPVKYIKGVPSPLRHPERVDMVIFRENMEDVYAGIEWQRGSKSAGKLRQFLKRNFKIEIPKDAGIGIKPISEFNTKRLVRKALQSALEHNRKSLTIVHKGNIMKFTEGAFRNWAYELAQEEFPDQTITEKQLTEQYQGRAPQRKIIIKDRIADAMFQQVLLRPEEYDVIATPNLNGDYLSDALSAEVGGLGMAPGANIGDSSAVFEATHGTAPKYAGKDLVNPGSLLLSGAMMLEYLGWKTAGELIQEALARTIQEKIVTYDLARLLKNARQVKCSKFGKAVSEKIRKLKV